MPTNLALSMKEPNFLPWYGGTGDVGPHGRHNSRLHLLVRPTNQNQLTRGEKAAESDIK